METVGVLSQVVAALAAVIGLWFIGLQIRQAVKTSSLEIMHRFMNGAKECENAIATASTPEQKDQAFIEFLNFLETYALAIDRNLIPNASIPLVKIKLRDSLAIIQSKPEWHSKLTNAVTSENTFESLRVFLIKNKDKINEVGKALSALA